MRFKYTIRPIAGIRTVLGNAPSKIEKTEKGAKPQEPEYWRTSVCFGDGDSYLHFTNEARGFSTNVRIKGVPGGRKDFAIEKRLKKLYISDRKTYVQDYNRAADSGIHQNRRIPDLLSDPDWDSIKKLLIDPVTPPSRIGMIVWVFFALVLLVSMLVMDDYKMSAMMLFTASLLMAGKDLVKEFSAKYKEKKLMTRYLKAKEGDAVAMRAIFELALDRIDWFQDSRLSYDILESEKAIVVDVELPDLDRLPPCTMRLTGKNRSVEGKPKDEKEIWADYANASHALLLRISGVGFALFPRINRIDVTGYAPVLAENLSLESEDQALLSIRFERSVWNRENVKNADAVAAVSAFQHKRSFAPKGGLEPIEPFEPANV